MDQRAPQARRDPLVPREIKARWASLAHKALQVLRDRKALLDPQELPGLLDQWGPQVLRGGQRDRKDRLDPQELPGPPVQRDRLVRLDQPVLQG